MPITRRPEKRGRRNDKRANQGAAYSLERAKTGSLARAEYANELATSVLLAANRSAKAGGAVFSFVCPSNAQLPVAVDIIHWRLIVAPLCGAASLSGELICLKRFIFLPPLDRSQRRVCRRRKWSASVSGPAQVGRTAWC